MALPPTPDINVVYEILRSWATARKVQVKPYGDLSREYQQSTGVWLEPHGTWDAPLGAINQRLAKQGLPAISALVVLKEKGEPGGAFWWCAPNVPPRPKGDVERVAEWSRFVKEVGAAKWPNALPP